MAYLATCTDKGRVKQVNEDACCVEVAMTPLGEVVMAVVCDGVGGLAAGELASTTVVVRFVQWFEAELPALMDSMQSRGAFDFELVRAVWGPLLSRLNDEIQTYGTAHKTRLGTTFTGIIACDGGYLLAHVGDCRAYQINPRGITQITRDQTLLAKKLADGELTPEQAKTFNQKNVILQSVGTQRLLKPDFATGVFGADDLFVICCDGVWRKADNAGVGAAFARVDHCDEQALSHACQQLLLDDLAKGERDNLTVVCFSGDLQAADPDLPTMVEPNAPTMVGPEDAGLQKGGV